MAIQKTTSQTFTILTIYYCYQYKKNGNQQLAWGEWKILSNSHAPNKKLYISMDMYDVDFVIV